MFGPTLRAIVKRGPALEIGIQARPRGDIAAKALDFLSGLDVFASNAGAGKLAPLATQSLAEWDRKFNLNVRSTFVLVQAFYPALKAAKGTIVVVASMSGMQAHLGQAAYAPA